ncbi:MAG: hypothetical protein ACTHK0_08365 [Ginsengibacter sp.]
MQNESRSWLHISDEIEARQSIDDGLKNDIRKILLAERKEKMSYITPLIKQQLKIKNGTFIPGVRAVAPTYTRAQFKGPVRAFPWNMPMPLTCAANLQLISSQQGNYTAGSSPVEDIEDFEANNRPNTDPEIATFLHRSCYLTNTATGEISFAGVTGFGSIPPEIIFPGKGLLLTGDIVHAFVVPAAQLGSFTGIQATARISNKNPLDYVEPGPVDSQVFGLTGTIGLVTISIEIYDPATGHYTNRTSYGQNIFNDVWEGTSSDGYYPKGIFYGNKSTIMASSSEVGYQPDGSYGVVDISTFGRLTSAEKPIYVDVSVWMYSVVMIGNEGVSGTIVSCQAPGTTPVVSFNDVSSFTQGSPFVVEEIRLCGF